MSTPDRLAVPHHSHYVLLRSHNDDPAFRDPEDYQCYLSLLARNKADFNMDLQAWCLLPQEAHILLCPRGNKEDLGAFMKHVGALYARLFNDRHGHRGTLWRGRYLSSVVEPGHWRQLCLRYIETLPVHRDVVKSLRRYEWTSWHARRTGDPRLDLDEDFLSLGDTLEERLHPYRKYMRMGTDPTDEQTILTQVHRGQLIGTPAFVDEVERLTGRRVEPRGPGRPRQNKSKKKS